MTLPLFPDESPRAEALRKSACRSNTFRDPKPTRDERPTFAGVEPVGRNADGHRIYLWNGEVWIGLYGVDRPMEYHSTEHPERDLEEARAWARMRVEWDASHGIDDDQDDDDTTLAAAGKEADRV